MAKQAGILLAGFTTLLLIAFGNTLGANGITNGITNSDVDERGLPAVVSIPRHGGSTADDAMQVLHEEARIFLRPNFLTPEECDYIIGLADPRMQRSEVVALNKTDFGGMAQRNDIRTSSGTFFERGEDEVIKAIEERIARWTLLPVGNGEGMQVLRYQDSQKYDAHWDAFMDKDSVANGGNRVATVFMYLNDVEEGGETVFPVIPAPGGENPADYSQCARKHLAVKPKKGSAILFHSLTPSGQLEQRSLHAGCPVTGSSVKYAMAKWIRASHFSNRAEIVARVLAHAFKTQLGKAAEAKPQEAAGPGDVADTIAKAVKDGSSTEGSADNTRSTIREL